MIKKQGRASASGGFTLVEALVGTGVFTLGILGSVGLVSWISQATAANGRIVAAEAFAQSQVEDLLESGYDAASGGTATEGQYDLAWSVTSSNGFKQIELDVDWENHRGQHKTVELTSMIADDAVVAVLPGFAMPGNGGAGGIPGGLGDSGDPTDPPPPDDDGKDKKDKKEK